MTCVGSAWHLKRKNESKALLKFGTLNVYRTGLTSELALNNKTEKELNKNVVELFGIVCDREERVSKMI